MQWIITLLIVGGGVNSIGLKEPLISSGPIRETYKRTAYNNFTSDSNSSMFKGANIKNEQFLKELLNQQKLESHKVLFQQELDSMYVEGPSNGFADGVDQEFCVLNMNSILDSINMKRNSHEGKSLVVDKDLVGQAQGKAQSMAQRHCQGSYDSSLFYGLYSLQVGERWDEEEMVDKLYSGQYTLDLAKALSDQNYYQHKIHSANYNNLFNMLWQPTQRIGCSIACCPDKTFWFCSLYPVRTIPSNFTLFSKHIAPRGEPLPLPSS